MTWHLVTPEHPPRIGGIASWTDDVARALHGAGHVVVVWSRGPVEARPWPVHAVPGRSWGQWGAAWMQAWVGPRLQRGDRVLVTNWELAAGPFGGLVGAARRAGARLDVVWHGSDIVRPERRPVGGSERGALVRDVVAQGGRHYAVSRFLAARLEATHGVAAQVLPAPIDPVTPVVRGPRWLVVTRLVPGKGVAQALDFAAAHDRGLTVVGEGPLRASLERRATELRIDAAFLGVRARAAIPWEGHEAVLLRPDAEEGLGLSLLEGAARGLASLGTRAGGVPEAALHLVDPVSPGPIPRLSSPEQAQLWLRAHHGSVRCAEILAAGVGRAS